MDLTLFWSLFVTMGISYFAVAMSASRNIEDENDFFFAKRKLSVLAITASLVATQVGGGLLLGAANESYTFGVFGIFYATGISVGFVILSLGFAAKLRGLELKTTAEIFTRRFHSPWLRKVAACLSIFTLGGILCAQIIASRNLLASLEIDGTWMLVTFWLLVISYTMIGGLRAVVATDIFQITLIILIVFGVGGYLVFSEQISLDHTRDLLNMVDPDGPGPRKFDERALALLLLPICYAFFAQDLGQRFFAAKSKFAASISVLLAGVLVFLLALLPVIVGIEAKQAGLFTGHSGSVFLAMVERSVDPFFYYLMVCAVIAALSSTADSMLCAMGSNLVEDLFPKSLDNDLDRQVKLLLSRAVVLIIGVVTLILAFYFDDILGVLSWSYEISVSCLLVPLFIGTVFSVEKKWAAQLSFIFGAAVFFIYPLIFSYGPLRFLVAAGMSLLGFMIGFVVEKFFMRDGLKEISS